MHIQTLSIFKISKNSLKNTIGQSVTAGMARHILPE